MVEFPCLCEDFGGGFYLCFYMFSLVNEFMVAENGRFTFEHRAISAEFWGFEGRQIGF